MIDLARYRVRIIPPAGETRNEVLDEALRVVEGTLGYSMERFLNEHYIRGVDALGAAGFTLKVEVDET